jgi:ABC-type molybdenum transport system ATPase subunit/photorepair protein PhrA
MSAGAAGPALAPAAVREEAVLTLTSLSRRFAKHVVVGDLFDLRLEPGNRWHLGARNKSGKSTVLRCVAGTRAPQRRHRAGLRP